MFLGLFLGGAVAVAVYIAYFNPRYVRAHHRVSAEGGTMVPPEMVRAGSCRTLA